MHKKSAINLFLTGSILSIGALLLLSTPEENSPGLAPVSSISSSAINRIKIVQNHSNFIGFELKGQSWFINHPLKARANSRRIKSILQLPQLKSLAMLDNNQIDASKLGFDPAKIIVLLNEHSFEFGNTDPIDNYRYVRVDQSIHLTVDNSFNQFQQDAMFFVSPRLVPEGEVLQSIKINGLDIINNGSDWSLSILNNDFSSEELREFGESLQNMEARQVFEFSNDKSSESMLLTLRNGVSIRFSIIHKPQTLIFARADLSLQYLMDDKFAARFANFLPRQSEKNPVNSANAE